MPLKPYFSLLTVLLLIIMPLAQASPLLWEPVADVTSAKSHMPGWAHKPKAGQPVTRVDMHLSRLGQLAVGDSVRVAVDGDRQFEFLITGKTQYANGDTGLVGQMPSAEQPSSLVLTLGEDIVLAQMATPDGTFALQAEGETGWVAAEQYV